MATVILTLTAACSGGEHLTFTVSGDRQATVQGLLSNMQEPITEEELAAWVKVMTKLARIGRTNQQTRTLLLAGITVVV